MDVRALIRFLDQAPRGTLIDAHELRAMLDVEPEAPVQPVDAAPATSWREKLWTVPADTRLGVREVAEACGRPRSWVYRRTSGAAAHGSAGKEPIAPLPHRKLGSELVFLAGEVRAWLELQEEIRARPLPRILPLAPRRRGA